MLAAERHQKFKPKPKVEGNQYGQIRRFLKHLGVKFYDKSSPNIGDFSGYFENLSLELKISVPASLGKF